MNSHEYFKLSLKFLSVAIQCGTLKICSRNCKIHKSMKSFTFEYIRLYDTCVCMRTCMYVYVFVCTGTYVNVYICVYVCICVDNLWHSHRHQHLHVHNVATWVQFWVEYHHITYRELNKIEIKRCTCLYIK